VLQTPPVVREHEVSFINNFNFWTKYWAALFFTVLVVVIISDVTAVKRGHYDGVGDKFTLTHWLVTKVGLSIIGAFIGYLVAHFLIVHRNG
jgi:general stress protein CsbA